MRYSLLALAMLVFVSPATASLQIVGLTANSMNSGLNEYAGDLDDLTPALVKVVTGDVRVLAAGTLTFFAHAAESSFNNIFHILDAPGGTELTIPETGDFGWVDDQKFSFSVPANTLLSSLAARFTTDGSNGMNAIINDINDGFGIFVASDDSYSSTRLYFGYDDDGAGPDDNHDDLIVSVLFTPSLGGTTPGTVPEPLSCMVWGLLAAAAMIVPGVARRR